MSRKVKTGPAVYGFFEFHNFFRGLEDLIKEEKEDETETFINDYCSKYRNYSIFPNTWKIITFLSVRIIRGFFKIAVFIVRIIRGLSKQPLHVSLHSHSFWVCSVILTSTVHAFTIIITAENNIATC